MRPSKPPGSGTSARPHSLRLSGGLQAKDLDREPRLADMLLTRESHHRATRSALDHGLEVRRDRLLEPVANPGHGLRMAFGDQELLAWLQLQPIEEDDHQVVPDMGPDSAGG